MAGDPAGVCAGGRWHPTVALAKYALIVAGNHGYRPNARLAVEAGTQRALRLGATQFTARTTEREIAFAKDHMRLTTTLAAGSLAVVATLFASPLQAAPILGTAGAGLQNASAPAENSGRYWDGNSWDSDSVFDGGGANPCNAGSLANGIPCNLNGAASGVAAHAGLTGTTFNLQYGAPGYEAWGMNNGAADLNYGFDALGGGSYDFTMLGEFTDDWDVNEIGWYDLGNTQNRHTIFGASAAVGSTAQVFIPGNFGFYYQNTRNGKTFFTQSSFNTQGTKQQFAAFQYDGYTMLGVEDIFSNTLTQQWHSGTADYDYNDVMFGFRAASVPEPSTLILLGMGVAGIVAQRRRRTV